MTYVCAHCGSTWGDIKGEYRCPDCGKGILRKTSLFSDKTLRRLAILKKKNFPLAYI